jgi:hypothetical protein
MKPTRASQKTGASFQKQQGDYPKKGVQTLFHGERIGSSEYTKFPKSNT